VQSVRQYDRDSEKERETVLQALEASLKKKSAFDLYWKGLETEKKKVDEWMNERDMRERQRDREREKDREESHCSRKK
jgi:hypothetical protein